MNRYTIRDFKYGDSDSPMARLQELEDKIEDGKIIAPPCKVNDKVWFVYTPKWPANPADKGKWFMIEDGVQRIIYGAKGLSIETWNVGTIPEKEIGIKLFFTKEDAEKVLAERRMTDE